MSIYIVESIAEPKQYWREHAEPFGWVDNRAQATEFDGAIRARAHGMDVLPSGGCWVIANQAPKHHFTTIKLRPVVIRLAATEGEYEDLNAQALEFEAALRQWVKGQQVLTDGWMVDVLTEDE